MDEQLLHRLGKIVAGRVQGGEVVGIGSGRTAEAIIRAIAARVTAEHLDISVVPTSFQSARLAQTLGLRVLDACIDVPLAWAFDGADEVDPNHQLIKGAGAAFLAEKVIARRAGGIIVVVTADKLVTRLGTKFPIPIEVVPLAFGDVLEAIARLGGHASARTAVGKLGPVVSDWGNYIMDATFPEISPELPEQLKSITGVVETGLFVGLTREVLVAEPGGVFRYLIGGQREPIPCPS